MAARKYHPLARNGIIFIMSTERVGVSAWIQFQSPSCISVRALIESRAQKSDQSLELYFQQFARHFTTSTHQVSPRLGEPCWKTKGAWFGWSLKTLVAWGLKRLWMLKVLPTGCCSPDTVL